MSHKTRAQCSRISAAITDRVQELLGQVFGHEVLDSRANGFELWNGHHIYSYEHAAGTERIITRWRDSKTKSTARFKDEFTLRTCYRKSYDDLFTELKHIMRGEFTQYLYLKLEDGKVIEDWYIVNLHELRRWLGDPVNMNKIAARQEPNEPGGVWDGSSFVTIYTGELPNGVVTQQMQNYALMDAYIRGVPYQHTSTTDIRKRHEQRAQA